MTNLENAVYRDSRCSVGERVNDLLSRMTLEEKAAQMVCVWNLKKETLLDEQGRFDLRKLRSITGMDMASAKSGGRATFGRHRATRNRQS